MDRDLHQQYRSVLAHEQAELERLKGEIRLKEGVIAGLTAALAAHDAEAKAMASRALPFGPPPIPEHLKYDGMSVRWAILGLLAEDPAAVGGMTTPEMTAAITAGGFRSPAAKNFAANVSAVVSDMVKKKLELELIADGKYAITPYGREVWEGIKRNPQYRYRRLTIALDAPQADLSDEG
jgi:hypothetical protein